MNLPRLALLFFAAIAPLSAKATIIDFAGYSYNTTTNITSGQGLDWRAASSYDFSNGIGASGAGAAHGWRTASTAEVATVLNTLQLSTPNEFIGDEYVTQGGHRGWGGYNHNAIIKFYQMFGGIDLHTPASGFYQLIALPTISFGTPDGHSLNSMSGFVEWLNYDFIPPEHRDPYYENVINPYTGAAFFPDSIMLSISRTDISQGIGSLLLVREQGYIDVPEPTSIALLFSGLIAVMLRRRRSTALRISPLP